MSSVAAAAVRQSLVAAAVLSLAACSGAAGEPTDDTSSPLWSPDLFTNDKTAFDYFLGKGLTSFQAAGIVGNLDQESGVSPTAVQSGGPGRGIAQWSVGGRWDTDANDNATWYASQQNQSVTSLQLQLDFVWYELTTFSGYGLAALKASTDVTGATVAFQDKFEGCGACNESQRVAYAQAVLAAYGNDTVDGGGGPAPDAGGPPCTVPGLGAGECILTTDCAAMPGHVSTPGYCPGPADIECCTGPSAGDGGTTADSGVPPQADGGGAHADGGVPGQGDAAGPASGEGDGGGTPEGDASSGPAGRGNGAAATSAAGGCSMASDAGAGSSSSAYVLVGLALAAISGRRRRAP